MVRTNFIPTILVIVLGVNLGAWTLSVATSPSDPMHPATAFSVPVSSSAIDSQSQAASARAAVTPSAPVPVVQETMSSNPNASSTGTTSAPVSP